MTDKEESVKRNGKLRNHGKLQNNGTRGDAPLAKRQQHNKSSRSFYTGRTSEITGRIS